MGTKLVLVTGALCVACLFVGAKIGQKASRGETLELPKLDPFKAIREHQDRKEAERERERYDAIVRNIDAYDGTGANQEDIPRG
jgi:hypothetical protein